VTGLLLSAALSAVSVAAETVDFPVFWRNQTNAAVRVRLPVTDCAEAELSGEIAGEPLAPRTVRLEADLTRLSVPFDPSRLKAGKYPWHLHLTTTEGKGLWDGNGELEIRPRLERNVFKLVSWGGWKPIPDDYLKSVGINSTMANVFKPMQVRHQVEAGFFPNLRYENLKKYKLAESELDLERIRETTKRDFACYEGLHVWTATLVNSEVYGSVWPQRATNQTHYLAWARRELGFDPDFRYRNAPIELNPETVGEWPRGIVRRGDCRQLDTLRWVMARGMMPYLVGKTAAEAIHGLDARNAVWSEPSFEGVSANFDMLADWHYQYRTSATVRELRSCYAYCRPCGKPYMPTLAAAYFHGDLRPRVVPVCGGKPRPGTQSADEVAIKAWLALAAVPAHALSFFALDSWSEGEKNGIAEPGTGAHFGQIWREQIAAAADLLRDLPNERAPIALVCPSECRFAGGLGWGQVHYPNCIASVLVKAGVPYDVLYDKEVESGVLKGYRYALLPMAKTLYVDHVERLEDAAAAGCCIVTDSYAARKFDKGVCLDKLTYPYDFRKNRPVIEEPVRTWTQAVRPRVREKLTAWSEGDGETAHTFVKETNGVRYVVVVNDRRRDEPGFLNGCVTNDWYRPYGSPQRIVTHLNVPDGSAIYDFGARNGGAVGLKDGKVELDYGAAQAKVLCVYPKPLAKLVMDVKGGFVCLALVDKDGAPAPGRQVVEVEVRDPDGVLHDETGRYVMEDGRLKVPLRMARDESRGSSSKGWRIRAKELMTGFSVHATSVPIP